MSRQVNEKLSSVKDFLAGRSSDAKVAEAADKATRQSIAEVLLAAMSRAYTEGSQGEPDSPREAEAKAVADREGVCVEQSLKRAPQEEQERARQLFMDHGYFDDTVEKLRTATAPEQRAAAARSLGVVGSIRGTPHLIAAMFDADLEVRNAAEEALAGTNDAMVFREPVNALMGVKQDLEKTQEGGAFVTKALDEGIQKSGAQVQSGRDAPGFDREDEAAPYELRVHEQSTQVTHFTNDLFASSGVEGPEIAVQQADEEIVQQRSNQATPEMRQATSQEMMSHESLADAQTSKEMEQLLLQEQSLREKVRQLEQQVLGSANVRTQLEKEAFLSIERETGLRAEAASRRREEEELRKRADEEAERRRIKEREAFKAEQLARAQAETEAHRISEEETRLRLESSSLRKAAEELVWQRVGLETGRREAAEAARRAEAKHSREEAEKRHNAELARLRNESEALRAATEDAVQRRAEVENAHKEAQAEIERLTKERVELAAAEAVRHAEATRLRQEAKTKHEAEVTRLNSEEEALRAVAEQVARRRAEVGDAQRQAEAEIERLTKEREHLAAAEAARRTETERIREAEERTRADHEQLRLELEGLRLVAQEVATRRAEVETARKKADEQAARLLEMQERMRAHEEASARAESERVQLEGEAQQRVTRQQRLLDEARRRAHEEQQRLDEEARRHAEHEEKLRAELKLHQNNAEIVAQQRAEEEKHIRSQVDRLRIADAEARKRIEEVEARRRKSEDVYRLVAEKVQRVEAEAHLRAVEEEQILAKLEAVRRNAAVEAQARAEQAKRIKEEIELFRKLEDVERPRLESAALERADAQARFQHRKDLAKAGESAPTRKEESPDVMEALPHRGGGQESLSARRVDNTNGPEQTLANSEPSHSAVNTAEQGTGATSVDEGSTPGMTGAVHTYLSSVDPYKRAAAVAEFARSNGKDAFDLIAKCFDDHSPHVRNAAARALRKLEPNQTVDLFNRALEEGSEERRRNIGAAIAASGLAAEAIDNLVSDSREDTYNALLILFVMAKAGEVQPLVQAIEDHENVEVCRAVIKLLTLTGQTKLGDAALQRRVTGVSAARRMAKGLDQSGDSEG